MRDLPLVVLLSNWYSGATLLTLLLNRHPALVSNGEIFPGWIDGGVKNVPCSCGSSVDACPFYREAAAHMWRQDAWDPTLFRPEPEFSRNPSLQGVLRTTRHFGPAKVKIRASIPGVGPRIQRFFAAQELFLANALDLLSGTVYLDGTKSLVRAELFLAEPRYARSPLILLVREPVSWCASWLDKGFQATLGYAIHSWREYIRRSLLLSRAFPRSDVHIVRYEALCEDPRARLNEIFEFIGLDEADDSPNEEEAQHHVLGNRMRLTFDGRVHPATDRSDELSAADRARVLDACRDLMELVGY